LKSLPFAFSHTPRCETESSLSVRCFRALIVIALLLLPSLVLAQEGGLRGSVGDDFEGAPLVNVAIVVEGSGQSGASDSEGRFFVQGIKPGVYSLVFRKDGFITEYSSDILVSAGSIKEVRIRMTAKVIELDEFVTNIPVEEESTGAEALIDIQKSIDSFATAIDAEFFSNSGASNAGDALKRQSGLSVSDGRYLVVRGLADRYNTVTLNGARIPSSDPDKRAVNIDIFPGKLIGNVVSSKTFTPDLPGESTGGSINIKTKGVPEKTFVSFSMSYGYNTNATGNDQWLTYKGGGTGYLGNAKDRQLDPALFNQPGREIGQLFGTDLLSARDQRTLRLFVDDPSLITNPRFAPIYEALIAKVQKLSGRNEISSKLSGEFGARRAAPPVNHSLSLVMGTKVSLFGNPLGLLAGFTHQKKYNYDPALRSDRRNFEDAAFPLTRSVTIQRGRQSLLSGFLFSANYEASKHSSVGLDLFLNVAADDTAQIEFGLDQELTETFDADGPLRTLDDRLFYSERKLQTVQVHGEHEFGPGYDAKVDWILSGSLTSQDEPDSRIFRSVYLPAADANPAAGRYSGSFGPPTQSTVDFIKRFWRKSEDTNYNASLNIQVPLFHGPNDQKAIAKFGGHLDQTHRDFRADNFLYSTDSNFDSIDGKRWSQIFNPTAADIVTDGTQIYRDQIANTYQADQTIAAGYGLVKFDVTPKVNIMFGARAESTRILIESQADLLYKSQKLSNGIIDAEGPLPPGDDPLISEIDRVDILPAIASSWDFAKTMRLRTAFSRTVARPSFKELAPVVLFDPSSSEIFSGNPNLEMSNIGNADVRFEWFPRRGDLIAVSGFTKRIDNAIELTVNNKATFYDNTDLATIYGYELEFQRNLGFHSEALRSFDAGFNYAYMISSVDLTPEEVSQRRRFDPNASNKRRLQAQPDYTMNFNLTWKNENLGMFAGLFYNVTGQRLYRVAKGTFARDIFERPSASLDLNVTKEIFEHWKLKFSAKNLLNDGTDRFYDTPTKDLYDYSTSGREYSIGLSADW
jgi:hypothetical protein